MKEKEARRLIDDEDLQTLVRLALGAVIVIGFAFVVGVAVRVAVWASGMGG